MRTSCLDYAGSHLCSYLGNRGILLHVGRSHVHILYILFLLVLMVELHIELCQFLGTSYCADCCYMVVQAGSGFNINTGAALCSTVAAEVAGGLGYRS
jgi:hypothetical protein